eukprot:m.79847 g.79847  ORF g.79847 m.79847 type:complete len:119 (+) comp12729_c0_seq4:2-358(+)
MTTTTETRTTTTKSADKETPSATPANNASASSKDDQTTLTIIIVVVILSLIFIGWAIGLILYYKRSKPAAKPTLQVFNNPVYDSPQNGQNDSVPTTYYLEPKSVDVPYYEDPTTDIAI